jgi:predicted methyltransferase
MNTVQAKIAGVAMAPALALALVLAVAPGMALAAADPAAGATVPPAYVVPAGTPAYVRHAIESPQRSAEQTARDVNRKPAELLSLSGVRPGERVIEFASFGQYFTTLLSDIVGPGGMVYMFDLPYTDQRFGAAGRAFAAAHPNTRYQLVDYNVLDLPQHVDVVFNVLYYHDLGLNNIDTASLNARIFRALKPGGIYFVVDHNAVPGSGRRDTRALHRIDPAVIRQEVTAAGFELVSQSDLLANSGDDHTQSVFAPGLRGHTDQTVFKFRKPRT